MVHSLYPFQAEHSLFIHPYLWASGPTIEELEPNPQVSKYVQSAVNNLQGARLVESLLLENSKGES